MNVLLIGSGAREHAIAWKLRQSPRLSDLFVAPGNPGTADVATNLDLPDNNFDGIVRACRDHHIDLVVVGNEEPLAGGIVDRLAVEGIAAFGPSQAAAKIESSKVFSKELMARHGIPTAPFEVFDSFERARAYVEAHDGSLVIKPDGLTKGKGVIVTATHEEAIQALQTVMVQREFGDSGARIVIEDRLFGPEVSGFAFTDGRSVAHMPFACDHKPIFDGDQGPNTGGMGAYTPPGWLDESIAQQVQTDVAEAVIAALASEGSPYRGVIYSGMMLTNDGPSVIEFNSRLGDPEAQVVLPLMKADLLEVCQAVVNNRLHEVTLQWSSEACIGVALASGGYPGPYETGLPIDGLDDLDSDVLVFHAGTQRDDRGTLATAGGRVLTVVARGASIEAARAKVYNNIERIHFEGMYYRKDIGATAAAVGRGA